ncbi:hypothetical protein ACFPYI_00245 [Halomarina salina]|uniref:CHAT domain-containing protein n=1 Tax=Halomarina salina TaxID=1872699 RepID=A0ABD5RHF0_9EURY|nr:hypothetical protein [Halomarina salina]
MTARLAIEASSDAGVVVVDDVQGVTVRFDTASPVSPVVESPEDTALPLDALASLDTAAIRVPKFVNVIVHDDHGTVVSQVTNRQRTRLPSGQYVLELESLAVKTYLVVDGTVETYTDESGRVVRVSGADTIRLGARSLHEFPAGTITTTDDPADVMAAVSQFGSALKTTSPERSWPTLRGHPPLLERGDELRVPESVSGDGDRPVTIRVPPRLDAVYPVAPLAYYLNARVEPGESPVLLADGTEHPLDDPNVETGVERTLRHLFFLDCLTRTEGLYPIELAEREAVETVDLGLDFAALYDAPLADRTRAYLDVPFDALDDHRPRWKTTADVRPVSSSVEQLPFLVNDLCTIRCPGPRRDSVTSPTTSTVREFARGDPVGRVGGRVMSDGGTARSEAADTTRRFDDCERSDRIVGLPRTGSIEHVWVGDGYRMGSAKPTVAARKRRLNAVTSGPIDVAVVVNDPEMRAEGSVQNRYGLRELVQFDVSVHEELDRTGLRSLLTEDRDFVHFVGHVDERGLQCADGYLDAATLDHVRTRAFVLNACQSYRQGQHLVDAGAIAGVVTFVMIGNDAATRIGRSLARLLNAGFSLGGALDVVGETDLFAKHYGIVGDQNLTLASSRGSTPISVELCRLDDDDGADGDDGTNSDDSDDDERFRISLHGHPAGRMGPGAVYSPNVPTNTRRYLNAGHVDDFDLTRDQLATFLRLERFPVVVDGDLHWSESLSLEDVD